MQDKNRVLVILGIFLLVVVVFSVRLFNMQVLDETYRLLAEEASIKKKITHPDRGLILDRNGKKLVASRQVYDVKIVLNKLKIEDTTKFCDIFEVERSYLLKILKDAEEYDNSKSKPYPFLKRLTPEEFGGIREFLIDYPGLEAETNTERYYPHKNLAHVLGYVAEIDKKALKRDSSGYYRLGDYVGKSGIEAAYEEELRGRKGIEQYWADNKGRRIKGVKAYKQQVPISGKKLIATIDLELQQYGESLFRGKKGAAVAIEPKTGEVLAMISAPTYDPNLLTGKAFSKNYGPLLIDENKPLFNRAIRAQYPPGSTFKTIQALIAMQEHVIAPHTVFPCNRSLVKCHWHPVGNVKNSIQHSCNPYYFNVFRRIVYQNTLLDSAKTAKDGNGRVGFEKWREYLSDFNVGRKTNIDLISEKEGSIPKLSLYDDRYGKGQWKFSNLYSLGIGQGEMLMTPLQLANVAATIANRGYYYTPHLIKKIGKEKARKEYRVKHKVPIDKKFFNIIIPGMRDAYRMGTVWGQAVIYDLPLCGKTGTAQNPQGEDHSVFIAFAPKDNPKIAMAVYVENAGFGGVWAAPIAALMIDKYIKQKERELQPRYKWVEKYVIDKTFIKPKLPDSLKIDTSGRENKSKEKQDSTIQDNNRNAVLTTRKTNKRN